MSQDLAEWNGGSFTPLDIARAFLHPIVKVIGLPRQSAGRIQIDAEEKFHWGEKFDREVSVARSDFDPLYRSGIQRRQRGMNLVDDLSASGARHPAGAEKSLTGTSVSAAWRSQAYPFRAW